MASIKRKFKNYDFLIQTHCGHDKLVCAAIDAKYAHLDFIAQELERRELGVEK
jgi:hypothetical protein